MAIERYMTDVVPSEIPLRPPEATITSYLPLQNVDIYDGRTQLDYVAPFLVTEAAKSVTSPFYKVDSQNPESYSIGLEDKLLGTQDIAGLSPSDVPVAVAEKFGNWGDQIIKNVRLLHGDDWAARAVALMRYGNVARNGPQGDLDRQILADLNTAYASLLLRLNGNVTQEGHDFRQRIYRDLGKSRELEKKIEYSKTHRQVQVPRIETASKYPRKTVAEVLQKLSDDQQKGWLFLREIVERLTDPKVRAALMSSSI